VINWILFRFRVGWLRLRVWTLTPGGRSLVAVQFHVQDRDRKLVDGDVVCAPHLVRDVAQSCHAVATSRHLALVETLPHVASAVSLVVDMPGNIAYIHTTHA
jgi:hypothetical protein